jgi:hypothetical protein
MMLEFLSWNFWPLTGVVVRATVLGARYREGEGISVVDRSWCGAFHGFVITIVRK